MNDKRLADLQAKNPGLPIRSVFDPEFRRFGRVVNYDATALIAAAEKIPMPAEGTKYSPDLPELESPEEFQKVQKELRGLGSCQIGLCWGRSSLLNCLEYHRDSEHNVAVTDQILLMAAQQALEGFELPAGKIVGFFFPKGTVIEVFATSLHFCPCQTEDSGFSCIVILPRGTNHPLPAGTERPVTGDGRLLWSQNKWLIAHPEAPAVARGAYPGIHGENFKIKY